MPNGEQMQVLTVSILPQNSNYYINNDPSQLYIEIVNYVEVNYKNSPMGNNNTTAESEKE